ncbi:MAG: hypothetical protein IJQ81_02515 [Oscillibacter sp.]|nr:hypothetical protein [Oscillibacter sp.]
MDKERPAGRGARGRGTTLHPERRAQTPSRTYPRPDSRPAKTTPPQYLTPERKPPLTSTRIYPQAGRDFPGKRIRLNRKSGKATAPKNILAARRFRDVLWPEEGETLAESRTAFFLSPLYALTYTACAALCVVPLNHLTAQTPFPLSTLIRALFPALIGAALCTLTRWRIPDEPRLMLLAHRRLLRNVLWIFIALQALLWGEGNAQRLIARFTLLFVAPPLVVGTVVSIALLYLDWRDETATDENKDA